MAEGTSAWRGSPGPGAVAASAAALGGLLGRGAYAAGSDAIRIGVIGCGGRGAGAALNAMKADPGVRLVALCDLFADRVKAKLHSLKGQKPDQVAVDDAHCFVGFSGYRQVIESADAALIACAPKFHATYTKAAIEAGRHVFVEKPHAIDPPGVRDLVAACEMAKQKKLSLVSGLYCRYEPSYQETIRKIHEGAIGDIVAIEESAIRGPYAVYSRTPGLTELQDQFINWSCFAWLSGDDVLEGLIHNLDRANWAMGERAPVKCHGLGGRSSAPDQFNGTLFDHHSVVYQYQNGVRLYAFARSQPGCYNEISSVVSGTRGRCFLLQGRIEGETKWQYRRPARPRFSAYDLEHQVLFKAIRSGTPVNNGDYMVRATMAAVMGQLSCYTGREVTWDQAMKSSFSLGPKPEECSFDMEPPAKPDEKGRYPVPVPGVTAMI